MRYIRTTNNQIEFIEANDEGKILNSIGLQLGEVYFQIKNGKVAFYLNDSEKPFDNFIWSMNLPITIDGEEYEDEDEVSAVLHNIMNDRFQEQLDALKEGLAAEEARAQEAEAQLDDKIDDESARAIAAENRLQDQVTELSGTVATFDGRITNVENGLSALTNTVNGEITRSTAKDAEHDTLISGLTDDLASEIARATARENQLNAKIDQEITDRINAVSGLTERVADDEASTGAALVDLNNKINAVSGENASQTIQISGLNASLNTEISRATSAETELHNEILAEKNRALAAESGITSNLNAEIQNRIADVDAEEARALAAESALTLSLNSEVTRSTAKDAEHDAAISDLTRDLATEVQNRITGDNTLQTNLTNERDRALAAESALTDALNAEITRSTSKDASHDSEISGLTTSLQSEINRAVGAENGIRNDLNSEISARTSADAAQLQRITALEVGKADANNVYTKAESDAKYATKDYISGLTDDFFNDVIYDKQSKRINFYNGNRIKAFVDASDFVKDGMVSDVRIANNNLVITFNTDAGKDAISIPLTDIFNPANYYTKSEVDSALSSKADKADVNVISGDVQTLNGKVNTISGEINTIKEEIDDIDLSNYYTKTESDGKYQLKGDYVTGAQMSAYTYDKQTIDDKIAQGGTFDPTLYYQKSETSGKTEIANALATKLDVTAYTPTDLSNYYTKSETSGKTEIQAALNGKQNTLTPGSGISIVNDVISVTGGTQPVDAYTKAESDTKFATITNFNSHSGNTTMHVTSAEKVTWNGKQNALTAGDNIDITNNVISTVTKFWCGTQSQYDAISVKDPNTVYMIHE